MKNSCKHSNDADLQGRRMRRPCKTVQLLCFQGFLSNHTKPILLGIFCARSVYDGKDVGIQNYLGKGT
jgi:hypothetical protein